MIMLLLFVYVLVVVVGGCWFVLGCLFVYAFVVVVGGCWFVVVFCLCSCCCGWRLLVCCWLFVYAFVVVVGESGLLVGSGAWWDTVRPSPPNLQLLHLNPSFTNVTGVIMNRLSWEIWETTWRRNIVDSVKSISRQNSFSVEYSTRRRKKQMQQRWK